MMLFRVGSVGILFVTLFTSHAYAVLTCPGLTPRPFSSIDTSITDDDGKIIIGKNIDCSKVALGAKVVTGVQSMIAGDLPALPSISFRMVDQYDNAFFNPEDISLNVPYQLVLNNYSKNPVYMIPVLAHEFGHAVLDKALQGTMPKWRSYVARKMTENVGTPPELIQFILAPYHEFFADVIAVLYTGAPDAVSKGLYMTGFMTNSEGSPKECPNKSDPKCRPRSSKSDISGMTSNRDFSDRSNQLGRWKGVSPDRPHGLLAPARYHVWKYYLSNPAIKNQKARLAAASARALMADLTRRLNRMSSGPGGLTEDSFNREVIDVQRTNAEFIDTIDAVFQKAFP